MAMLTEVIAAIAPAITAKTAAADPIDALARARWALEGSSDFWALTLQIATGFVALGVVIEIGATILEVLEDRQHGSPIKWHQIWTFVGGAFVAIFVVVEGIAELHASSVETELRHNNAAAQGVLDKRERDATAAAVAIANRFGGLQSLVSQKIGEMDAEEARLGENVADEKRRTETALNTFKGEQGRLQTALTSAEGSASKAATAQDSAARTAASMTVTLNSEQAMRDQMHALITRRVLTDANISALADRLKEFKGTPYALYVNDDDDSRRLMVQILEVLTKAGWEQKASASIPGFSLQPPGAQAVPLLTSTGLSIEIAQSARPAFEKPVLALAQGLADAGANPKQPSAIPDDQMATIFDHKIIHIFVGARN